MYRRALLGGEDLEIQEYISSIDGDKEIAEEVLRCLMNHVRALMDCGLAPKEKCIRILDELEKLIRDPSPVLSIKAEDIHEALEMYLRRRIGDDEGYLALGRSRNDHVSCALRLKTRKLLINQIKEIVNLRRIILDRAEEHLNTLMPAFTHLRPAQLSTFAHYLCYLAETLSDYTSFLMLALKITDRSPLGGGAVSGTRVPLDRRLMARGLFKKVLHSSIRASSGRDFMALTSSIDACLSVFLSRVAEDLIVLSSPNFGYLILPDEHLSTSSMMPQKRNPVTMEVARAWGSESVGHLVAILGILKALPSGYNLDMQEANGHHLRVVKGTTEALRIFSKIFSGLRVNEERVLDDLNSIPILATDLAEEISMRTGEPYRKVHEDIAKILRESKGTEEFYSEVEDRYGVRMSPEECIRRPVIGSPNPDHVKRCIEVERGNLKRDLITLKDMGFDLGESEEHEGSG